jgi:hypothetical protein
MRAITRDALEHKNGALDWSFPGAFDLSTAFRESLFNYITGRINIEILRFNVKQIWEHVQSLKSHKSNDDTAGVYPETLTFKCSTAQRKRRFTQVTELRSSVHRSGSPPRYSKSETFAVRSRDSNLHCHLRAFCPDCNCSHCTAYL